MGRDEIRAFGVESRAIDFEMPVAIRGNTLRCLRVGDDLHIKDLRMSE